LNKAKDTFAIKEELERLRERLNKDVVKNIEDKNNEDYESLLATSRELDNIIINYIKDFNQ
jgi:hypothetical protein